MKCIDSLLLPSRGVQQVSGNRSTLTKLIRITAHASQQKIKKTILEHTKRYPPPQPVTIIPIATDTRAEPKTLPTTVGMVAKNPPFAMPLMITKMISGPREIETGQRTSMLNAVSKREMNSVFRGPSLSLLKPQRSRPTADEKLKAATRPAPALELRRRELAYRGKKNGGTKRGNVATAPATKSTMNRISRNSRLKTRSQQSIGLNCSIHHVPVDKCSGTDGDTLLDEVGRR